MIHVYKRKSAATAALVVDVLVEHARDHLDLGLCCCDLLCGRGLGTTAAEEEGHCCGGVEGFCLWVWWVTNEDCVGSVD